MDDRRCATEQELVAWIDAVQAMDAMMLGDFERRIIRAYRHSSLVPLQIAMVSRRAQLERGALVPHQAQLLQAIRRISGGGSSAGEIVDDGKAVRFAWGSDRQWTETVPMEHVERNSEPRPPRNRWK